MLKERWWTNNPQKKICTNEDEDTGSGGISINNIGGVFIIIFGGIFLAVLTLTLEFTILKFGWSTSCSDMKPVNELKIQRWELFSLKIYT